MYVKQLRQYRFAFRFEIIYLSKILVMNYSSSSDSDWEEELNEMAVAFFLNESTSNRQLWVHPINAERNQKSVFLNLFPQLKNDPDKFHQYFRMSLEQFTYLHDLVKDSIKKQNTHFREAIPSEQRLAVCLR